MHGNVPIEKAIHLRCASKIPLMDIFVCESRGNVLARLLNRAGMTFKTSVNIYKAARHKCPKVPNWFRSWWMNRIVDCKFSQMGENSASSGTPVSLCKGRDGLGHFDYGWHPYTLSLSLSLSLPLFIPLTDDLLHLPTDTFSFSLSIFFIQRVVVYTLCSSIYIM